MPLSRNTQPTCSIIPHHNQKRKSNPFVILLVNEIQYFFFFLSVWLFFSIYHSRNFHLSKYIETDSLIFTDLCIDSAVITEAMS